MTSWYIHLGLAKHFIIVIGFDYALAYGRLNPLQESKFTCFHEEIAICEQLIGIPIPLSYTRLTSRFLVLWHLTLPVILWDDCRWIVVPSTFISAASLFCIEEIYVGGLDPSVSLEDLRQTFSQYGDTTSVRISGGKRFGFVEFANRVNRGNQWSGTYYGSQISEGYGECGDLGQAIHTGADLESAIDTCLGYSAMGNDFMKGVRVNPVGALPSRLQ
ncbi:hypothetical protein IFM89_029393, partial [Coptis chinensis]